MRRRGGIVWGLAWIRGNEKIFHFGDKGIDFGEQMVYNILCADRDDPLAQLVEHLTFNQRVRRSSRRWVTKFRIICRNSRFFVRFEKWMNCLVFLCKYPRSELVLLHQSL